ncbi:sugar MFS transporter [Danxiaibacter flavus]|uniref:Sugar MFS transporter n=1 Tax=Danxiaibacter flavus TaxID=3049108 RepID=A0ABV3ZI00_9BACT|nr:sugar MFS transporter [Chitinophagaceae bacterium DXS]
MSTAIKTPPSPLLSAQQNKTTGAIFIIGILFFIFGFVTWANSTLIPYLGIACQLTTKEAVTVTFAFYISYAVMAFPSSWVLKQTGFKNGMMLGLLVMAVGALLFIPAAKTRTFGLFLFALFVIGTGLALLQTASNPYITILGPIESAAKRISIMGICNKTAGALAPLILGAIVLKDSSVLEAKLLTMNAAEKAAELDLLASRVILPYVIIAAVLVALAVFVYFSHLPEVKAEGEDSNDASSAVVNRSSLFSYPYLWLGFISLFLYVGVEVMAGDIIQVYGKSIGISLDVAKHFTTYTMIGMLAGYLIGIAAIPKYISQNTALKVSAILGLLFSLAAIFTSGYTSVLFIAFLGLANALIWPALWPLTIEGLGKFTKTGSALLIVGIGGGAVLPRVWATLGEQIGLQQAFWIMVPAYLFILYFAIAGHKVGK